MRRLVAGGVTAAALFSLLGPVTPAPAAPADVIVGLTADSQLVAFLAGSPAALTASAPVTGLRDGESLVAIDYRPATGVLTGMGDTGRVYTIEPGGAATGVGVGLTLDLDNSDRFGFDFNPVSDVIRLVSASGGNARIDPVTGSFVDADAAEPGVQIDGELAFAAGDANAGDGPSVVASAYSNNVAGASVTTNYAIDTFNDVLVTQGLNSPAVSPDTGQLFTVGALGAGNITDGGLDIAPDGTAYAVLVEGSGTSATSDLYTVDLATGAATNVGGDYGGGSRPLIIDVAVAPPAPPGGPVVRLAGEDRIGTATAISRSAFPATGSAGGVVLATSLAFPDALAGTPLAAAVDGPVLLTNGSSASLDTRVRTELLRAHAPGPGSRVFVVGGTGAVSAAIEAEVAALGYDVDRLAGGTRFATAVAIATVGLGDPARVVLATGRNAADALVGGAVAAALDGAVLLTDDRVMALETGAYLAARPGVGRVAIGGQAAAADPSALAVAGADRFRTATLAAVAFFDVSPAESISTTFDTIGFASGRSDFDALAGGAHVASFGGPLLLVEPTSVPAEAGSVVPYLAARADDIDAGFLYGGVDAVNDAVLAQLVDLIN